MAFNEVIQNMQSRKRLSLLILFPAIAFAQADPWSTMTQRLMVAFTGPIATGLILVACVVTGLVFAFSEGQGKRQLSGLAFGGAMAIGATRFAAWLFT